jgi:hypothetical protein
MCKLNLYSLAKAAALVLCVCVQNASCEEPSRDSENHHEKTIRNEGNGRIKAGYGTDDYHLGMLSSAFDKDWEPHWKRPNDEGYLIHRKLGIAAIFFQGRVIGINFNYAKLPREAPCRYKTEKGIGPSDAIVDVESTYGEPSHIDMTPGDANNPAYVDVFYCDLGIEFEFRNLEMANVKVSTPRNDFDYDHMKQWLVYIRQPPKK